MSNQEKYANWRKIARALTEEKRIFLDKAAEQANTSTKNVRFSKSLRVRKVQ